MPNYDYVCLNCRKRFTMFIRYDDYGKAQPVCPHCKSNDVRRKIGRVRVTRSSLGHLEDMSDPKNLDALDEDPRALGKMMREMSGEIGEDMGPQFDEVVHRLERGQSPDEIEKDMPELQEDDTSSGSGDFSPDDL